MENTGKLFEDDSQPKWFIALGDRWVGPLTSADVYDQVLSMQITWAHYVWKKGMSEWKRLCDIPSFQAAVPHQPPRGIQAEVKEAAAPTVKKSTARRSGAGAPPPPAPQAEDEPAVWYLFYNDSQFGPFKEGELRRFLKIGKIHGRVHAWRDGFDGWERLEKIPRFEDDVAEAKRVRDRKKAGREPEGQGQGREQRSAPRRPLLARILMASDNTVITAVCRDISIGGMQVLTDRIPGVVGSRIKLNVSPAGMSAPDTKIEPFVAEGVLVRILEDGRGFSFRFERLPDVSRRAIEEYIRTQG